MAAVRDDDPEDTGPLLLPVAALLLIAAALAYQCAAAGMAR